MQSFLRYTQTQQNINKLLTYSNEEGVEKPFTFPFHVTNCDIDREIPFTDLSRL